MMFKNIEITHKKEEKIVFILSLIVFIITIYTTVFLFGDISRESVIKFCKNKTGIYNLPNCSGAIFCFGMGVTINCTRINEEYNN